MSISGTTLFEPPNEADEVRKRLHEKFKDYKQKRTNRPAAAKKVRPYSKEDLYACALEGDK